MKPDETPETPTIPDMPPEAVEAPATPPDPPADALPAPLGQGTATEPPQVAHAAFEYPQVLYHRTHGAKTVQSVDERNALGEGWVDHPVEKD